MLSVVLMCCFYLNFTSACHTKMKNMKNVSPNKDVPVLGQIKSEYIHVYYEIYKYFVVSLVHVFWWQNNYDCLNYWSSLMWQYKEDNCFLFVLILTIFYLCIFCLRSLEVVTITTKIKFSSFDNDFPKEIQVIIIMHTVFSRLCEQYFTEISFKLNNFIAMEKSKCIHELII